MERLLLEYRFDAPSVTSTGEHALALTMADATVVDGPGATVLEHYPRALALGTQGQGRVWLEGVVPALDRFCVEIVFQAKAAVGARQRLVESNLLPFALSLEAGSAPGQCELVATVKPERHSWAGPDTRFKRALQEGQWYTASLAYDLDTAALFVDHEIVSVHAFPYGSIKPLPGSELVFGIAAGGIRDKFAGNLAAFRWYAGIPEELETQLDERRTHAEWFISYKLQSTSSAYFGARKGPLEIDEATGMQTQYFERGAIAYHDGLGAAHAMHGAIYQAYIAHPAKRQLGYLVTDELPTKVAGGRKNAFSRGAIYWSTTTGAIPMAGQLYVDYENLGESATLGLPTSLAKAVPGGVEQALQHARLYHRTGEPSAHAVRGAILEKFVASGGIATWGFPVTNELDIKRAATVIGKASDFERCTIYFSTATGAHEVHGAILAKYEAMKGPLGELGFPTSDERDIPDRAAAGRFNTFENGSLLWFGTASIEVARPFKLYVGRIDTYESEGWGMGENDIYCRIKVSDGGNEVYNRRHPGSGDWEDRNVHDLELNIPVVITPNSAKTVTLSVEVWDADPGNDDHLGKWTHELGPDTAWGLRSNNGVFSSGNFSKIRNITGSVKPVVDMATLEDSEMFWGVANKGTPVISEAKYAAAFRDVDSDREWYDPSDWVKKAFYELVIDSLAGGGNCFGMSLEAIKARKGASLFGLPLDRFKTWGEVESEFNISHCYQIGASAVWWFIGEFLTGNTHDPTDVFRRTRAAFNRGSPPVLCVSQDYDFGGAPHAILPVKWDDSSDPWKISILDPNFPGEVRTLTVRPSTNEFRYVGGSTYEGGAWEGGRMHYMPYSILDIPPRTPVWDLILLILAGTILVIGEDTETISLTDLSGTDLDGYGQRSKDRLKTGQAIDECFMSFAGYNRLPVATPPSVIGIQPSLVVPLRPARPRPIRGEVLLRRGSSSDVAVPSRRPAVVASSVGLDAASRMSGMQIIADALAHDSTLRRRIGDRAAHRVLADSRTVATLGQATREAIETVAADGSVADFVHRIRGRRNGALRYAMKHGMSDVEVVSTTATNEVSAIQMERLGTSAAAIRVAGDRAKTVKVNVTHRLGAGTDRIRVSVDALPLNESNALEVNFRPGLGGLDVVALGQQVTVPVVIEGSIGGRVIQRAFQLPLEGGARVNISDALAGGGLSVSKIDRLYAPARETTVIR